MSDWLERLAEARIQDWQRRLAAGESVPAPPPLVFDSWESQMVKQIVQLRRQATAADDPSELLAEATKLQLQLLVVVERDRPRLARELERVIARGVAEP